MINSCKKLVLNSYVRFFSFYLIFGNILRFVGLGFEHNLLVSEFILYFFTFVSFVVFPFKSNNLLVVFLLIFSSSVFGLLYNGFHLPSLMYGIRLIGMVFSGAVAGRLLYLKFGNGYSGFLKFFESIYVKNAILGILIFAFFPDSKKLWLFLLDMGIDFKGDPHQGRFVSTYFDPNYFGAICCIPFIISHLIYKLLPNEKGKWKLYLFLLVAILTWSRSGITTMLLVITYIAAYRLRDSFFAGKIVVSKRTVIYFFLFFLVFTVLLMVCSESFLFFLNRVIHMNSDPSALGRLYSFQRGFEMLFEYPVFGVGYNYLPLYFFDPSTKNIPIDSSLMVTIISFGMPITITLIFVSILVAVLMYFRLKNCGDDFLLQFYKLMLFYLIVCVFFTSNFNNLLYYPFWLIPVIAIFSYLTCCIRAAEASRRNFISSSVW